MQVNNQSKKHQEKQKLYKQEKLSTINHNNNNNNNNHHRFHFFFSFPFYSLSFSTVSGHCSYVCVLSCWFFSMLKPKKNKKRS